MNVRFTHWIFLLLSFCVSELVQAQGGVADKRPALFLIGDSTVKNGSGAGGGGLWGWGNPLDQFFDTNQIRIVNRALGGRSSRTFLTEGLWDKVLSEVKPGDYVIMQFGHNDGGPLTGPKGRASLKGNGDETQEVVHEKDGTKEVVHTYGWYLRKYISDAKAKGATPIVCSLVPRNIWQNDKVVRASSTYGKWAEEAARQEKAYFVDLNDLVARKYENLGQQKVTTEFFLKEHTHTTLSGAVFNAQRLVEALKDLEGCGLGKFVKL